MVAIALEHDVRLHFWQARLHDARLREGGYYYPVGSFVGTGRPTAGAVSAPVQSGQSGSCQSHRQLLADRGAPSRHCVHVPAAIPLRLENQYFSLDVSHPLATEMLQSGTCMFYVPGMLGEPELELFAVLRT